MATMARTHATDAEAAASGPPVPPLPFPHPIYTPAKRVLKPVKTPQAEAEAIVGSSSATTTSAGHEAEAAVPAPIAQPSLHLKRAASMSGNVLVPLDGDANGNPDAAVRAYWIQRKIASMTCGSVRIGYVLRRQEGGGGDSDDDDEEGDSDSNKGASQTAYDTPHTSVALGNWEVTPKSCPGGEDAYEMVAIKMYERTKLKEAADGKRTDNPIVDICASQLLAPHSPNYHHVLGIIDVLADERFVYCILPYCSDGNLLSYVEREGRLDERTARHFFKQILSAIGLFQSVGICHRDLSLEHILLCGSDCFVVGKNKALRIPYSSSTNDDGAFEDVTDVSSGTLMRLISPQGQCGTPYYLDPVLLANSTGFDGHAADVWSAGVILFHMLFGFPPFVWAGNDDPRFMAISVKGQLDKFVAEWTKEDPNSRCISNDAIDLLQSMLRGKPQDRLSINGVLRHSWVVSTDVKIAGSLSSGASSAAHRASLGK